MDYTLTDEQKALIEARAEQEFKDPREHLRDVLAEAFRVERAKLELRQTTLNLDESFELERYSIHKAGLGLVFGTGEGEGELEARTALEKALRDRGLSAEVSSSTYSVGRSADAVAVLLEGLGTVAAIAGTIVIVGQATKQLKSWISAIREVAEQKSHPSYTAEFLKAVCVNDAVARLEEGDKIDVAGIKVGASAGQYMDGSWSVVDPIYIAVPILEKTTLLYVVSTSAEILHVAELPYNGLDAQSRTSLRGAQSSMGHAHEAEALKVPESKV